jgi:hypothetical protein
MSIPIGEHVEQICRVMLDSLAHCPDEPPGFRVLAATVLEEHTARLRRHSRGPHPPWLVLPVLVQEALAGEECLQSAYHVAAAWELGNMAAGQLDAWQDQDTNGALWQRTGPGRAVNLSVGLIGLAFRTLSGLVEAELLLAPVVVELQRGFADTLLRMVAGQHADLGDDLELEDYQAVAEAKTGSLFRLGAWCGTVVAGASADVAERYGTFGEALGLLIQAWNDLYGLEGALGKEDVGHQRSLPILAALAMAGGDEPPDEVLVDSAEGEGGRLYALVQAELLHQVASDALALCPAPGRLSLFLDSYSTGRLLAGGKGVDD